MSNHGLEINLAIEGMTCASCVRHVEKALQNVGGVTKASVNLAMERATVTVSDGANPATLLAAIEDAGYHAKVLSHDSGSINQKK